MYFLIFLDLWNPRSECQYGWVLMRVLFLTWGHLLLIVSPQAERETNRKIENRDSELAVSSCKGTTPSWGPHSMASCNPDPLSKSTNPSNSILGIKTLSYELRKGVGKQHNSVFSLQHFPCHSPDGDNEEVAWFFGFFCSTVLLSEKVISLLRTNLFVLGVRILIWTQSVTLQVIFTWDNALAKLASPRMEWIDIYWCRIVKTFCRILDKHFL